MKIFLLLVILLLPSCASTFVNEKATEIYAESLESRAKEIRSNPQATPKEKSTADELDRAAYLIRSQGKENAKKDSKIQDLSWDSAKLEGIYWTLAILGFLVLGLFGLRFALKRGVI
jgi:hypothetical protein